MEYCGLRASRARRLICHSNSLAIIWLPLEIVNNFLRERLCKSSAEARCLLYTWPEFGSRQPWTTRWMRKCAINCVVRRQNLKTTKNLDRAHESMHENEIYRWLHRRNVKVDRQYIHLINFSRLLARLMGVIVPSRYSYYWQAPWFCGVCICMQIFILFLPRSCFLVWIRSAVLKYITLRFFGFYKIQVRCLARCQGEHVMFSERV